MSAAWWSPDPILGFRYWRIDVDGLRGVRGHRWAQPQLEAVCRWGRPGPAPHLSGECGRPPCGVYALKEPGALVSAFGRDSTWSRLLWEETPLLEPGAYGVVALSGRIVEHERGYRAARASVRALVVVGVRSIAVVADRRRIGRMFADPYPNIRALAGGTVDEFGGGWEEARLQVVRRLCELAEEEPWTSVNSSV
ncbi:MAG TPA: hypothetical protein VLL51_00270 [Gemmatimonadales bacterium]|nr:hypothetical protein [Gemmatimonadales bacterium]